MSVLHACPTCPSYVSVLRACPTRLSYTSVLHVCPTCLSYVYVLRVCPTCLSYMSLPSSVSPQSSSSCRKWRHLAMSTLIASPIRTSGASAPVDSTRTETQRHMCHNYINIELKRHAACVTITSTYKRLHITEMPCCMCHNYTRAVA